ncbi:hypothetical protein Lalb_Chr02g0155101 [Lupinus albus]|uniref:Uncharacterized protein n=1 Tax=Lupinus albus TaxID=3870 RepID=A0A6A4R1Y1_LUPAL|nr:hypothetical protein Lalb_Chr14g0364351 [Lupinus albus]KAE9619612.1 hypothetical protein Lalb_Chr02g0155101 [Lupinus albus]
MRFRSTMTFAMSRLLYEQRENRMCVMSCIGDCIPCTGYRASSLSV